MKFEKLEKISGGAFLHRYDITYSDEKDRRFTYEMVSRDPRLDSFEKLRGHKPDAVVMALTDRAGERFVLIHEFRLELGRRIYGLPGGLIDGDETPEEAALRELGEETGLQASQWIDLGDYLPSPGYSGEIIRAYLAMDLSEGEAHTDEDEFLVPVTLPVSQALDLVMSGAISDGKTAFALLKAARYLGL